MLPLKVLSTNFYQECVTIEVSVENKTCRVIYFYRSLTPAYDKFRNFLKNLEINLGDSFNSNLSLFSVLGCLNATSNKW